MLSYNRKIHLPYTSFLICVSREALIIWKTKSHASLCHISIQITKQDFCGLCFYIATLLAAPVESEWFFPSSWEHALARASWPLPWFLYSTALEMEPQSECWLFCSVFAQCDSTPVETCLLRFTLGLVLKAQWAATAESASVALWRAWQQCPEHRPGKCPSVALLL